MEYLIENIRNNCYNKSSLSKLSFSSPSVFNEEPSLEGTIFEKYKTIIFDLDGTILDCFTQEGESRGAWQTVPPYSLKSKNILLDIKGNTIQLQDNIKELIEILDDDDKNLGIVSRGEKLDTPFASQPSVMILKKFDIFKYFNHNVILKAFMEKRDYIRPFGKTLFIDNKKEWVDNVGEKESVDVLWRNSFNNWFDLLQKTY